MAKLLNYLWITLLSVYIISPIDANPLFFDDLIAAAALFYFLYKNAKQKQQQYPGYDRQSHPGHQSQQNSTSGAHGPLTLDKAYKILGVSAGSTLDEINRAYKEKMTKSHPDKVSHLSEELQEKAKELTLELNEAYALVKRYKKG
ncbi:MAG: DnaJ domain-containing protein [Nitrospirae bacterium]|nr:DnaJ domain-containing protein [Nitrospirota bacterium]